MPKLRTLTLISIVFVLTLAARSAHATDDPPTAAPAAAAAQDDDDATLQLAEPDFRLINMPTTLRLPLFKGNFDLTHRFAGNLRQGDLGDQLAHLFGIDEGATVGFEYRFGIAPHLELAAYRTTSARTIQIYAKYDAIHQRASMPFSASLVASVEGTNNLKQEYAPSLAASLSYMVKDVLALYAVPTWVHNSAAATGIDRDTGLVGLGGRLRIRPTVYLAVEASPRFSGYAPGTTQYGFAIEKRAGGHMFQLNFTNSAGTTPAQIARGGQPDNLGLGFNLSRKFF
jgi:uncharacterized beta barrel domain-containing protein DUF5777